MANIQNKNIYAVFNTISLKIYIYKRVVTHYTNKV